MFSLTETGDGVAVVRAGEVVAEGSARVMAMRDCGCSLNNGYMQLSLLALVVIPELRISDLGLVDVTRFAHVPVIHSHQ